jgi:hypothetical protein
MSSASQRPWNAGRIVGAKPPLKPKHIWGLGILPQLARRIRDLVMFNLAIVSKLRGRDLAEPRVGDLMLAGSIRPRSTVCESRRDGPSHSN